MLVCPNFIPLGLNQIPRMGIPHFVQPFTCQRALGLLQPFAIVNHYAVSMGV
jgi:hypothetical protein